MTCRQTQGVVGLPAGVWVDRVRRRTLLFGCQLVLAVLTLSVPVAGWLGALRLEHLFLELVARWRS